MTEIAKSPAEMTAKELLDAAAHGSYTATLEVESLIWKARQFEERGACICPRGPSYDGPEEDCPQHGRTTEDLWEMLSTANTQIAELETALREASDE